jgi:hypothetical protein
MTSHIAQCPPLFSWNHALPERVQKVSGVNHMLRPGANRSISSAHYHILSGLFLAYEIYSPKFAAKAPAIVGTYREDRNWLWAFAGVWAVSNSFYIIL